jgi:glycogen debranching enzyme
MLARPDDSGETAVSPFYIPSTGGIAGQHSYVLKQGDSFAVLDAFGDIQAIGPALEGLFFEDTRYLGRLALTIDGLRPLLLSSTVTEDNAMLSSDLTNPDLVEGGRLRVPRDTVHILRSSVLGEDALFQVLELLNYGAAATRIRLGLIFDADFADMFEVRGTVRPRRGDRLADEHGPTGPALVYRGLDDVVRRTAFEFQPVPVTIAPHAMQWTVDLPPGATEVIRVAIRCSRDIPTPASPGSARAVRPRRHHHRADDLWLDPGSRAACSASSPRRRRPRRRRERRRAGQDPARDAQGRDGALGEVPFGRYYGSVDATPLFVMLAGAYFERTGDLALIRALWPNVERGAELDRYLRRPRRRRLRRIRRRALDGLVQAGLEGFARLVFHADGSLAEGRSRCARCRATSTPPSGAAELARALGETATAARLDARRERCGERFEAAFWCEELVDLRAGARRRQAAVPGARLERRARALLTGIAGPERARGSRDAARPGSFSGWGIRTVARRRGALQPDVVPQRLGLAARQRADRARARALRDHRDRRRIGSNPP